MANTKEIRNTIKSIQSTQKITKAMEMVAASKMRKAQDRMFFSRPYSEKIKTVISHISKGRLEYKHSYAVSRKIKKVGIILISTDRGLCGGLNVNLFKTVLNKVFFFEKENIHVDFSTVGKKAEGFFSKIKGCSIIASKIGLGDYPQISDFLGVIKVMLDQYDLGKIDSLYLAYNKFVNTMVQKPIVEKLIPIEDDNSSDKKYWDYIYEPDAQQLLDSLLKRYIESLVYQGIVENIACEQAARMVAMKNATSNAGDIIDKCKLMYNKARQASITQELSEIVAGADAV